MNNQIQLTIITSILIFLSCSDKSTNQYDSHCNNKIEGEIKLSIYSIHDTVANLIGTDSIISIDSMIYFGFPDSQWKSDTEMISFSPTGMKRILSNDNINEIYYCCECIYHLGWKYDIIKTSDSIILQSELSGNKFDIHCLYKNDTLEMPVFIERPIVGLFSVPSIDDIIQKRKIYKNSLDSCMQVDTMCIPILRRINRTYSDTSIYNIGYIRFYLENL